MYRAGARPPWSEVQAWKRAWEQIDCSGLIPSMCDSAGLLMELAWATSCLILKVLPLMLAPESSVATDKPTGLVQSVLRQENKT